MNLKTSYEIFITEKLEQELPVPDMLDAIWARIEMQLDIMPEVEADASADFDLIPGGAVTGKTLAIITGGILSLVILFFLLKSKIKNPERLRNLPSTQQQIKVNEYALPPDTASGKVNFVEPSPIKKINTKIDAIFKSDDAVILKHDSVLMLPPAFVIPDTPLTIITQPIKRNPLDSLKTMPATIKPRGVPIPIDEGYKIKSQQYDSLERRN